MSKNAYITLLGRSSWALINTYYAVLKKGDYVPDVVYVFVENSYEDKLEKIISGLEILSEEFGIKPEIKSQIVNDADFKNAGMEFLPLMKKLKEDGFSIAVDITPGRKSLVAAALLAAKKSTVIHVFYLAVDKIGKAAFPYMMIPLTNQILRDFIKELKEGG